MPQRSLFVKTKIRLDHMNMKLYDLWWTLSVFIIVSQFSPLFMLLTFHIYLSSFLRLIHVPPLSFFFSLFGTLSFSSYLCLHLLIIYSVLSSITFSGLIPSHPSSSVCPKYLSLFLPFSLSVCLKSLIHSVFL